MKRKISLKKFLFVVAYTLALGRSALGNTTFTKWFSIYGSFLYVTLGLITVLIIIKFFFADKFSLKNLIVLFIIIAIFGFSFLRSGYSELLIILLLILGSKDISIEDVIKTHLYVYGFITLLALFCSLGGIIDNYVTSAGGHQLRYSLGNTYPTDFAAGILSMVLDYAYLKSKKWKLSYSIGLFIIAFLLYKITQAQTSSILICVIAILQLIVSKKWQKKGKISNFLYITDGILFPFFAIVTILIQANYDIISNPILRAIDLLLNYRISYGFQAVRKYGIRLWGRRIDFIGAGWNTSRSFSENYFYVDNGYLQCALLYGLVILIFLCLGYSIVAWSKCNRNNIGIATVLLIYSVWGIVEPRIFNIIYSPFLIAIGITIYRNYSSKRKKARNY